MHAGQPTYGLHSGVFTSEKNPAFGSENEQFHRDANILLHGCSRRDGRRSFILVAAIQLVSRPASTKQMLNGHGGSREETYQRIEFDTS